MKIKDCVLSQHHNNITGATFQINNGKPYVPVVIKMTKNDDYTTGNLLDYLYHQNYYELIGKNLSRQTNSSIPQQINLVGKLEEDNGAVIFYIAEKQQKTIPNFSLDSLIVTG